MKSWPKTSLPSLVFLQPIFSLLSLSAVAFSHHHPHQWSSHHHLYHKKPSKHLTWWLHRFSLSSTKLFFSATVTPTSNHLVQKLLSLLTEARTATLSSATPTVPTASFPSPLQAFASSSSCNQSQLSASPPLVAPYATNQDANSLNAR